jgi:hypothetical protein
MLSKHFAARANGWPSPMMFIEIKPHDWVIIA